MSKIIEAKVEETTYLGNYLLKTRLNRGYYRSVSEYLYRTTEFRGRKLSISNVYYRELEAGKKTPSLDTLLKLSQSLDLDKSELCYHWLQDTLPQDVFAELIGPEFMRKRRVQCLLNNSKNA